MVLDHNIYEGVVKSFNPTNGYGFVACDETMQAYGGDVFLHKNELQQSGCGVGSFVKFKIQLSDKGQPRAVSVQDSNDTGPMPSPAPMGGGKPTGKSMMKGSMGKGQNMGMSDGGAGGMYTGVLKSFNQEKGYGFISCQETEAMFGSDIFLHFSEAIGYRVGDTVGFEVVLGPNGKPQARNLVQKKSVIETGNFRAPPPDPWAQQQGGWGGGGWDGGKGGKGGWGKDRSEPYGKKGGGKDKGKGFASPTKEFVGIIKTYNAETGYGFIDCHDVTKLYARDAFLPRSEVDAHGLQVGEEIVFTVEVKQSKPVAKVKGKKADMQQESQAKIDQCGMGPHVGMIKSYNEGKGFGFIECEATYSAFGQDVFLHKREMEKVNEVGVTVQFNIQLSDRGQPQAIDCQKM